MLERNKSRLYNIRAAPNINEKRRTELLFEEVEELQEETKKRIKKNSFWSTVFRILNTILGLILIFSSGIIIILEALKEDPLTAKDVSIIVLGAVIFIIAGATELLNLSQRGYHYRQGTIRLRRILGQVRDLIYLFHDFKIEEILAFVNSYRSEIDEIDLDLYKSSMSGDVKIGFGNEPRVETPKIIGNENIRNNSDIHIYIDSSESPNSSPKLANKKLHNVSTRNSPVMIRIETNKGKDEENEENEERKEN